jgi:hypothetical protein
MVGVYMAIRVDPTMFPQLKSRFGSQDAINHCTGIDSTLLAQSKSSAPNRNVVTNDDIISYVDRLCNDSRVPPDTYAIPDLDAPPNQTRTATNAKVAPDHSA